MKWISTEDELPPEEKTMNELWFDVWIAETKSTGFREPDVKYTKGEFYEQVLTEYGDFAHEEKLSDVTHWMKIEPPTK